MKKSEIIYLILVFIACITIFVPLILVIINSNKEKDRVSHERCQQIAKLAGTKEYIVDYNNCYIINGTKLEKIEY